MTMAGHTKLYITKHYHNYIFVKTQRNSTQRKATLKQLALELDTVVTWNPPPQTFRPLLDQLESWNLAQTLTRPTWLT